MSKLRGDDDIMSLMNELSSNQGYTTTMTTKEEEVLKKKNKSTTTKATSTALPQRRVRSVDENNNKSSSMVYGDSKVNNTNNLIITPTNPTVEIFRRRAFERFKEEFKKKMELTSGNAMKHNNKITNMWSKLSMVSVLERWHFNLKLQENIEIQKYSRINDNDMQSLKKKPTTKDDTETYTIFNRMEQISRKGMWMDPVLISDHTFIRRQNVSTASSFTNDIPFKDILTEEIEFEWIRAWRRHQQDQKQKKVEVEKDWNGVFSSKIYQRKLSGLSHGVRDAAIEALSNFRKDMERRSAMELTKTTYTNNKKKKKKKHGDIPKIEERDEDVQVTFSGLSLKINYEHYHKLMQLFEGSSNINEYINSPSFCMEDHKAKFVSCLFALLARYDMLQGAGLQSAVHHNVFDVLFKHYKCNIECFASPFNCTSEKYFSAFPDTDAVFGSLGSFFDYNFSASDGGCFQANPPFASGFIHTMATKMEQSLLETETVPLMFIIFIPNWDETKGWKILRESQFLSKYVVLDQKTSLHYYTEGTQYRRKGDKYRVASFDTSIFFLQNSAARSKWKIQESHIDDIKNAFGNNYTSTTKNQYDDNRQENNNHKRKRREKSGSKKKNRN